MFVVRSSTEQLNVIDKTFAILVLHTLRLLMSSPLLHLRSSINEFTFKQKRIKVESNFIFINEYTVFTCVVVGVCMYVCIYVCMYICMYVYVCMEYLCLPVTAESKFVLMYLLHKLENKFQYIFMNKSR